MTDKPADVGLCFLTSPPLIVPISQRAKDRLQLPEGVDCALFMEQAEKVIALFGEDYVFLHLEEYEPKLIMPLSIQRLH